MILATTETEPKIRAKSFSQAKQTGGGGVRWEETKLVCNVD